MTIYIYDMKFFEKGKTLKEQCADVDTSLTASVSKDQLNHQRLMSIAYDPAHSVNSSFHSQSHHQLAPAPTSPIPTPTP